jgi:hypothetical protein
MLPLFAACRQSNLIKERWSVLHELQKNSHDFTQAYIMQPKKCLHEKTHSHAFLKYKMEMA